MGPQGSWCARAQGRQSGDDGSPAMMGCTRAIRTPRDSNAYSNTIKAPLGVGPTNRVFECSSPPDSYARAADLVGSSNALGSLAK